MHIPDHFDNRVFFFSGNVRLWVFPTCPTPTVITLLYQQERMDGDGVWTSEGRYIKHHTGGERVRLATIV